MTWCPPFLPNEDQRLFMEWAKDPAITPETVTNLETDERLPVGERSKLVASIVNAFRTHHRALAALDSARGPFQRHKTLRFNGIVPSAFRLVAFEHVLAAAQRAASTPGQESSKGGNPTPEPYAVEDLRSDLWMAVRRSGQRETRSAVGSRLRKVLSRTWLTQNRTQGKVGGPRASVFFVPGDIDDDPLPQGMNALRIVQMLGLEPGWYYRRGPLLWIRYSLGKRSTFVPSVADAGNHRLFRPSSPSEATGWTWDESVNRNGLPELVHENTTWNAIWNRHASVARDLGEYP